MVTAEADEFFSDVARQPKYEFRFANFLHFCVLRRLCRDFSVCFQVFNVFPDLCLLLFMIEFLVYFEVSEKMKKWLPFRVKFIIIWWRPKPGGFDLCLFI